MAPTSKSSKIYYCNKLIKEKIYRLNIHLFKPIIDRNLKDNLTIYDKIKFDYKKMYDWYHIESVFKNSFVNFKTENINCESGSEDWVDCYSDKKFQLVDQKDFDKIHYLLFKKQINDLGNTKLWKKYPETLLDICFVQKLNIINPKSKIFIVGDFHSSFHSLYYI